MTSGGSTHEFKIGELAARCGVSRDALRFYEREGILPPPRRTGSGQRLYDEEAVQRVEFIRQSQQMGLTLDDVRELLKIVRELPQGEVSEAVSERLRVRIQAIDEKLSTLRDFRRQLAENLAFCHGSGAEPGSYSIIRSLLGAAAGKTREGD